jgi:hypothetical protein
VRLAHDGIAATEHVTGDPRCDALRAASTGFFARMPNGKKNER